MKKILCGLLIIVAFQAQSVFALTLMMSGVVNIENNGTGEITGSLDKVSGATIDETKCKSFTVGRSWWNTSITCNVSKVSDNAEWTWNFTKRDVGSVSAIFKIVDHKVTLKEVNSKGLKFTYSIPYPENPFTVNITFN